jgi:hypothetical protein
MFTVTQVKQNESPFQLNQRKKNINKIFADINCARQQPNFNTKYFLSQKLTKMGNPKGHACFSFEEVYGRPNLVTCLSSAF